MPMAAISYFEVVNSNLLRLGSLTLDDFLRDPYQEPIAQENFLSNPLYHDAPLAPPPIVVENKDGESSKPAPLPAPIFVLHQICSQTFGSIDALNYEIIEEEAKESAYLRPFHRPPQSLSHAPVPIEKRCILTITRPNGATRSYTSKPEFARKAAARAAAASVAVDMGAIDFIKHGSPDAVVKRGLVLAPLDAPGSVQAPLPTAAEEDPSVQEIEKCCVEWRASRVKPRWIFLIDSKPTGSEFPPILREYMRVSDDLSQNMDARCRSNSHCIYSAHSQSTSTTPRSKRPRPRAPRMRSPREYWTSSSSETGRRRRPRSDSLRRRRTR